MKTIRLGIVGLGYIGKIHLQNCMTLPNAEVLAVADVSKKALSNAKKLGVKKTYASYSDLLKDKEIDAVIIGLPTHLHLDCAVETAEAGKPIFLEKPIARNVEEAKAILLAAQRNSVKIMMGYHMRFNQEFIAAKKELEEGLVGDVENAYATYISSGPFFHRADGTTPVPVPDWWFNKELTGGGVLMDLGSHMINLMRWYFGEIVDIKGYFGHRFNLDFEDSAMCLAKFDSGTVALINVGWFSQDWTLKLEFFGSVKNIIAQHLRPKLIVSAFQMLTTGRSKFFQAQVDELRHFTDCVANDLPPSPSGQDGLKDIEAMNLAYRNKVSLDAPF